MESLDEREDLGRSSLVQVAGWLVCEQKARVVYKCASKGDTLLLATGKLAGPMVCPILKADFREPFCRHSEGLMFLLSARQQRHRDIFQCVKLRQQIVELPYVSNLSVAKGCSLASRQFGNIG